MPDICAKMGANLFWAYVGHEDISFLYPHFLNFYIWVDPIFKFSGHIDAKTVSYNALTSEEKRVTCSKLHGIGSE